MNLPFSQAISGVSYSATRVQREEVTVQGIQTNDVQTKRMKHRQGLHLLFLITTIEKTADKNNAAIMFAKRSLKPVVRREKQHFELRKKFELSRIKKKNY